MLLPQALCAAVCPTFQRLALGCEAGIPIYASNGDPVRKLAGHSGQTGCLAFLDSHRLLSGNGQGKTDGRAGEIKLWDVTSGLCTAIFFSMDASHIADLADWDGETFLAACSWDRALRRINVHTGEVCASLEGDATMLGCVAASPDGRTAASGGYDQTVRLWDIPEQRLLAECPGHTGYVRALAFSQDGSLLLSGAADHSLRLWDSRSGRRRGILSGHSGPVWCLAMAPDGVHAVSGSYDESWRLWDLRGGQCIASAPMGSPLLKVWFEPASAHLHALSQSGRYEQFPVQPGPVQAGKAAWRVFVGDNFQRPNADAGYPAGDYASYAEAVTACQNMVDQFLHSAWQPPMTAEALYEHYTSFGADPYVVGPGPSAFSAWDYARSRCQHMVVRSSISATDGPDH